MSVAIDYVINPDTNYEFKVVNGAGDTITRTIREEYDTVPPEKAIIEFDTDITYIYETIQATVTQEDLYMGIDITKCKYIINNSEEEIGIESEEWATATSFINTQQTINITEIVYGYYYVHVLSVDNAGNKLETVSSSIEFKDHIEYYSGSPNAYSNNKDWTFVTGANWNFSQVSSTKNGYIVSNSKIDVTNVKTLEFSFTTKTNCSGGYHGRIYIFWISRRKR